MQEMIYLSIAMMIFLLIYVLIGFELMTCTLLFLILLVLAGKSNNEIK
tara:strand:- start:283 stop:426 length:144 start_codon:yes stop_codon:yes gene_type:complete